MWSGLTEAGMVRGAGHVVSSGVLIGVTRWRATHDVTRRHRFASEVKEARP